MPDLRDTHLRGETRSRTECGLRRVDVSLVAESPSCPVCHGMQMEPGPGGQEQPIPVRFMTMEVGQIRVHRNPGGLTAYDLLPAAVGGFMNGPRPLLQAWMVAAQDALNLGYVWDEKGG